MSNREYRRTYYLKHPERAKASSRAWQLQNPEKLRKIKRDWRAANPEKNKEHRKNYRLRHPEKVLESSREWKARNPEKEIARKMAANLPYAASCELCPSTENLQHHHPDYSEPLIVVTLCQTCHKAVET